MEVHMKNETKKYPDLLTEQELIEYLRIPEVSKSSNYHNVIEHLKRMRNLPRIHLCSKALYPLEAIRKWIEKETTPELGEKVNNKIHELDKKQKELGVSQGFTNIIENIDQIFMNLGTEKVLSSKYPEIFNIVWQVKRVNFFSRMSQALAKKID